MHKQLSTVNTFLQPPCLAKRKGSFVCHLCYQVHHLELPLHHHLVHLLTRSTTRRSQQIRQDRLIEVCRTPLDLCVNALAFIAKHYVKITLNGTYELLKITTSKGSSAMLAPLSSAFGSVLTCVYLYKVISVASLMSTLPLFLT